jgi:uncharacterized protein
MTDAKMNESTLKTKLQDDMKTAMKSGDKAVVAVLRMLTASIKNTEIARQKALDDSDILGIISKEVRQHEESITAFKSGNRDDLVQKEEAEMATLKAYLPEQLPREEIVAVAKRIVEEVGASGPHDKGKVMPRIMGELKGKADGRIINEVVTELLS